MAHKLQFDNYRSTVFSVLKCEYRWNGVQSFPGEFDSQEEKIKEGHAHGCNPRDIAKVLHKLSTSGAA